MCSVVSCGVGPLRWRRADELARAAGALRGGERPARPWSCCVSWSCQSFAGGVGDAGVMAARISAPFVSVPWALSPGGLPGRLRGKWRSLRLIWRKLRGAAGEWRRRGGRLCGPTVVMAWGRCDTGARRRRAGGILIGFLRACRSAGSDVRVLPICQSDDANNHDGDDDRARPDEQRDAIPPWSRVIVLGLVVLPAVSAGGVKRSIADQARLPPAVTSRVGSSHFVRMIAC